MQYWCFAHHPTFLHLWVLITANDKPQSVASILMIMFQRRKVWGPPVLVLLKHDLTLVTRQRSGTRNVSFLIAGEQRARHQKADRCHLNTKDWAEWGETQQAISSPTDGPTKARVCSFTKLLCAFKSWRVVESLPHNGEAGTVVVARITLQACKQTNKRVFNRCWTHWNRAYAVKK